MPKDGSVFPYGITLDRDGEVSVFPAAEVLFPTSDGEQAAFLLLVDSGARISALPKSDAETLGLEAEKGIPAVITGISGEAIQGWKHDIAVVLNEEEYTIPVVFLDLQEAPRILGREEVFDRFTIVFQEKKNRTGFFKNDADQSNVIGGVLDNL